MAYNNIFEKMCREATEELTNGKKGWREVSTNALFLACFGMLAQELKRTLARPLWWFALSISGAAVGYIVNLVIRSL